MNKRKRKIGSRYRQLQTKIFFMTALMMFAAVLFIVWLYAGVLQGRFANAVVAFFMIFFHCDFDTAKSQYQWIFRNNIELVFLLSILVVFLIILRFYLRWFTKYFNEIDRGIDALIEENADDVSLSPELNEIEKKINSIKHMHMKQKLAAETAEKKKNDLVVYLAHDLKTPLTSVIGYLTLLRDEKQISEELREKYLSISLEKAEHLEDLVNEFFEITRFNLSNIILEYSTVNLSRLFEQLVYEFNPMFREKNLECHLEAAPDVMVRCDVDKMQRVFDNLLRNAVNYSFENDSINITVHKQEKEVRITFSNHGNTIPKEKLERIFEQFYRLDTARGTKSGGAGLGLAIAKEIVELHCGSITAWSEAENIEFQVALPLS